MKKRILFINQSRYFSAEPIEALEEAGFEVSFVQNASEAIDSVAKSRPDLIITGLQLVHGGEFTEAETYGMCQTGAALYRHFREHDKDLPIIITSESSRIDLSLKRDMRLNVFLGGSATLRVLVGCALEMTGQT